MFACLFAGIINFLQRSCISLGTINSQQSKPESICLLLWQNKVAASYQGRSCHFVYLLWPTLIRIWKIPKGCSWETSQQIGGRIKLRRKMFWMLWASEHLAFMISRSRTLVPTSRVTQRTISKLSWGTHTNMHTCSNGIHVKLTVVLHVNLEQDFYVFFYFF